MEIVGKFPIADRLFGETDAAFIGFGVFRDEAHARSHFESPEYKAIEALKDESFLSASLLIVA